MTSQKKNKIFLISFGVLIALLAIANTAVKGPLDTFIFIGMPCVIGYALGRFL